jgi:hypothetical protein
LRFGNLEIRVSDSQGNAKLVGWKEGNTNVVDRREEAIAVISEGCNMNLSKDSKLTGKQQGEHYRETIYIHRLSAPYSCKSGGNNAPSHEINVSSY